MMLGFAQGTHLKKKKNECPVIVDFPLVKPLKYQPKILVLEFPIMFP